MAITRPFSANETTFSQANPADGVTSPGYGDWFTYSYGGTDYLVSPSIDAGSDNELMFHRVTITFAGGTTAVSAAVAYWASDVFDDSIFTGFRRLTDFQSMSDGVEADFTQEKARRYAWVVLDITGSDPANFQDIFWTGTDTFYGHESFFYDFGGGTGYPTDGFLPYRFLFPKDYDSNQATTYPIIIYEPGTGGVGDTMSEYLANTKQIEPNVAFSSLYFANHFMTPAYKCFSVAPMPITTTPSSTIIPSSSNYYPWGDDGAQEVPFHNQTSILENGYYCSAIRSLLISLIANADYKIDTSKIYVTGFSMGGIGTFDLMKTLRDYAAAGWAVEGTAIGPAYISNKEGWYKYEQRMDQEVQRYFHIPVLAVAADNEGATGCTIGNDHKLALAFDVERIDLGGGTTWLVNNPATCHVGAPAKTYPLTTHMDFIFGKTQAAYGADPFPNGVHPKQIEFDILLLSTDNNINDTSLKFADDGIIFRLDQTSIDSSNENYDSIQITYNVIDDTAVNGVDFIVDSPAILTFLPGETEKIVPLQIVDTGTPTWQRHFTVEIDDSTVTYTPSKTTVGAVDKARPAFSLSLISAGIPGIRDDNFRLDEIPNIFSNKIVESTVPGPANLEDESDDFRFYTFYAKEGDYIRLDVSNMPTSPEGWIYTCDAYRLEEGGASIIDSYLFNNLTSDGILENILLPGEEYSFRAFSTGYITLFTAYSSNGSPENATDLRTTLSRIVSVNKELSINEDEKNIRITRVRFLSDEGTIASISLSGQSFTIEDRNSKLYWNSGGSSPHIFDTSGDSIERLANGDLYRITYVGEGSQIFDVELIEDPDYNVLFVYKGDDAESEALADLYVEKYYDFNVTKLAVDCSSDEILDSYEDFQDEVEDTIKTAIDGSLTSINVVILGYNVPGGFIDGNDIISSTSRISKINFTYSKKENNFLYNRRNPYVLTTSDFSDAIICSRIDGPTLEEAKKLIKFGDELRNQYFANGRFYFDAYSNLESGSGSAADSNATSSTNLYFPDGYFAPGYFPLGYLLTQGLVIPEDIDAAVQYTEDLVSFQNNLLLKLNVSEVSTTKYISSNIDVVTPFLQHDSFYWGWFTDRTTQSYFKSTDTARAFFYNADFDSASTLRSFDDGNFAPLAISAGYVGIAGALSNPTISGFLRPDPFFKAINAGAKLGEAYLLSEPFLNWTNTLIGDPLATFAFPENSESSLVDDKDINESDIWNNLNILTAKMMGNHWGKEINGITLKNEICCSTNMATEIDLLSSVSDLSIATNTDQRIYRMSDPLRGLFDYASQVVVPNINSQPDEQVVSFEDFLEQNGYDISELYIGVHNDVTSVLPSSLYYSEGFWTYEDIILDELGEYAVYNFDLEVSDSIDFSTIIDTIDTTKSIAGWQYEKEFNVFEDFPAGGVTTEFVNMRIRYNSVTNDFLTRGQVYYFRIRQKTDSFIGDFRIKKQVIYT